MEKIPPIVMPRITPTIAPTPPCKEQSPVSPALNVLNEDQIIENLEIMHLSKRTAKIDILSKHHKQYLKLMQQFDPDRYYMLMPTEHKQESEYIDKYQHGGVGAHETIALFITINPPIEVDQDYFIALCHKFFKKQCVTQYVYTFENPGGKHIHMHGVFYLNKSKNYNVSKVEGYVKTHFGKLFPNPDRVSPVFIHIKRCTVGSVEKRINYCKGLKKEDEKMLKVEEDDIWKELNGIEKYYSNI